MSGSIQSTSIKSGRTSTMRARASRQSSASRDLVSGAPQAECNQVSNGLFIFNDEDAFGCHVISASPLILLARYYSVAV